MKKLKPYAVFSYECGAEMGAILVFAPTSREAKRFIWKNIFEYSDHINVSTDEYIEIGVKLIKNGDHLYEEADPDKLTAGVVHAVLDPKSCPICGQWGEKLTNGMCAYCSDEPWCLI